MYKVKRNTLFLLKNKKTVASCGFFIRNNTASIWNFSVEDEKRGKGKGEEFLIELILHLKKLGIKTIELNVLRNNLVAQNLYFKLGFRRTKKEKLIFTMTMDL